jgi:hypothetical protein
MLLKALRARPQAILGLLIMTLSILAFQAGCNIMFPSPNTASQSPSLRPLQDSICDLNCVDIQSRLSDLSDTMLQISGSMASLHSKLDSQTQPLLDDQNEKKGSSQGHQPSASLGPAETLGLIGFTLLFPFFIGISLFIEDASHVSNTFLTRSVLLILWAANAGLATGVFWGRHGDGMWFDYVLYVAWPTAIAMLGILLFL